MPLTPEEEAEYQALSAQYNRPTLPERFAAGSANLLSSIPESIIGGATGLLNTVASKPLDRVQIPPVSIIPPPQSIPEFLTDVGPHMAGAVATMAAPQIAGARALEAMGVAGRMAQIGGGAAGGAWFGANMSPESAVIEGGVGALGRATDFLPRAARLPIAAAGGLITGMDAYHQGASPAMAVGAGLAQTAMSFLPGQEHMPFPFKPVPMERRWAYPTYTPDEIIPPTGRWGKASRISDALITEQQPAQAQLGFQPEEVPRLMDHRAIVPVEPQDPLAFSKQLYDRQLADRAAVVPFVMKDGVITPTYAARPELSEPSAREAAIATLQEPLPHPPIDEILPAIRVGGKILRGQKFDTHEMILNRHLNENIDDADALLNFDSPENPNFFVHGDRELSRRDLKMMYKVKDSQGLARLQRKALAPETPAQPAAPPKVIEPEPIAPEVPPIKAVEPEPEVVPSPVLPRDMTPQQRIALRLAVGKATKGGKEITEVERQAIIDRIVNPKPKTLTPSGKPSRAKPLDIEKFTDGNDLRIVPGEGKGGIVFESMRDAAPGKGKVRFEVPEGTSHAEANKMYKAKKAELLATLQEPEATSKPHVPFQDIASSNEGEAWLKRKGMDVSNYGQEAPAGLSPLRKRRGQAGNTFMDILTKGLAEPLVGGLAGGIAGATLDDEDKISGFIGGAMAGGILTMLGHKGIRFLLDSKTPHINKGFEEVAQQAARGRGSSLSKLARWMENNFTVNDEIRRALSKASGEAHMAALAWDKSLRFLSHKLKTLPQHLQDDVHAYATADPLTAHAVYKRLAAQVGNPEVMEAMLLERVTRMRAQSLILEGIDPKSNLHQIIQDSLGTYQKTAYKIHFDPKYRPSDADVTATIQELYMMSPPGSSYDTARATVEQYLHDIYVERGMGRMSKYGNAKGAENLGDILRHKNPELAQRPAFRAMMGEVTDPLQVRTATALKLIPAIRSAKFFSEMVNAKTAVGNKFALGLEEWDGTVSKLRKQIGALLSGGASPTTGPSLPLATLQKQLRELENYIIAPDSPSLGLLAGKRLHRQVYDRLPSNDGIFEGNSGPIISSLMAFNNHVKAAKVGANPLSWTRSFLSVPFFMGISRAGTPMNWLAAAKEMKAKGRMWSEAMQQGIMSGGYGTGESKRDLGIILDPNLTDTGLSKAWNKWVSIGASAMDSADSVTRLASYMNNKARLKAENPHLSEQQLRDMTTDFVNRYTMNYSTVSKGVRGARQLPMFNQFLTYTSEMARITKNLIEDVRLNENGNRYWALGTLAAIPAVFEAAQMIFENDFSEKDKAEWRKTKQMLPEYKRYSYLLPTKRRADGTWDYYNISPLFVADDIMKMVKSIAHGDMDAVMANNPLVGWDNTPAITVGMAAAGYDVRGGREIPDWRNKFDAIRKEVLPPLIGGYEFDNFVKALTPNDQGTLGITNQRTGQRFEIQDLLQSYITGARKTNVRLDVLQEREFQLADRRIKAIEADMRRMMMTNSSPAAQDHAKEVAQKKVKRILEELERKMPMEETR